MPRNRREPRSSSSPSTWRKKYDVVFAVRIDGASMAPEILHGDVVILSPSCPAEQGKPAVVQLADKIGVTCKLFRRREIASISFRSTRPSPRRNIPPARAGAGAEGDRPRPLRLTHCVGANALRLGSV